MKEDGRKRVIIEKVKPEIDCGKFPVKRVPGETLSVSADIFTDGHDMLTARLLYKTADEQEWNIMPMTHKVNDRWTGSFPITRESSYSYTIDAWINPFSSWLRDFNKKVDASVATENDLLTGLAIIRDSAALAKKDSQGLFDRYLEPLGDKTIDLTEKVLILQNEELTMLMDRYPVKLHKVEYPKELIVEVERKKALFSSWYEFFPRSASFDEKKHGTFKDMEKMLPYIAELGFDVLYLPPIHPIGQAHRKGKNNSLTPSPEDTGSPWAIGSKEGGHKAIHPELGTEEDFRHLIAAAADHGIETALDIAFQCSPDHPWVKAHPSWFKHRPDGSIQYAENPPKKYEDIYPINFETEDWKALWEELKSVFVHWIEQGVKIFRIDNPHTKPFRFWEWVIHSIRQEHPDVLFLAEAFTRPKVMEQLAKSGFSQSYTYFTWRNTKEEITKYIKELTTGNSAEVFRPNFWPNTPDILPEYLQSGGRSAFIIRHVLAATLSSNYGIYGPAFELTDNVAREFGSEEYLNSEKYQIKEWDLNDPVSLKEIIKIVNTVRKENPSLQNFKNTEFHHIDDEHLLSYSRYTDDMQNIILIVINLDPYHKHAGWVGIPPEHFGLQPDESYQVYDLLGESWYLWHGEWNYVELDPHILPAHIFKVRRKVRTEKDFDYFL